MQNSHRRRLLIVCLLMVGVILTAPTQASSIYYVSPNGSDANPGTFDHPFQTIMKGVQLLAPGDMLYIREGTYNEVVSIYKHGTEDAPIIISGYPGEKAIIDGLNKLPAGDAPRYKALVFVQSRHVIIQDLVIQNSRGRGIEFNGSEHSYALRLDVNHNIDVGLMIGHNAKYVTAEDCRVWQNSYINAARNVRPWSGGLLVVDSEHSTVIGCEVFETHGEGLADLRSKYTTFIGNTIHDNFAVNMYLDNSAYSVIDGNFVYCTDNRTFWRSADAPTAGIVVSDETYRTNWVAQGTDQVIINNIVYNCGQGIAWWPFPDSQGSALKNALIAHNTLIDNWGQGLSIGLTYPGASHTNTRIENNIVKQPKGVLIGGTAQGISYASNNWSRAVSRTFTKSGDKVGDPQLQWGTGTPNPEWFRLTASSPGINAAKLTTQVTNDFFGTVRDANPDMGAHEYTGQ